MAIERERWLEERRQNNWVEVDTVEEMSTFSIASQLLGFGSRGKGKKK
jgi:hypothetical protein